MTSSKDPNDPSGVVVGTPMAPTGAPAANAASMKELWQQVSGTHNAVHGGDVEPQESSKPVYRLPQKFGKYTLIKRLGVGGMAEAFLAQQDGPLGFQKLCVVKRMLPHIAEEPRFVTMFQREAKVAAMLTHSNVVQIYELGVEDGIHFIAMEYVDGAPLHRLARASWRRGKAVPTEVICCAIADAALGLAAAHELRDSNGVHLNVVHRDISPDNLMINKEGVTKILDFGVAKLVGGEKTATGEVKGKIPFLAPEHILGQALDGRADIYALGVTFYWLTTGKRPFHAPGDLPLMEAIVKETPKAPVERNPQIPPLLNDLILRMIAKDPAKRPQTGFEVHDILQDAIAVRRQIVVPFLNEMLAATTGLDDNTDAPLSSQTPGFVPSSTQSENLKSAWKRRIGAPAIDIPPVDPSSSTVETVPHSTVALIGDDDIVPKSNKLLVAIFAAVAVVVVALVAIIVAMTMSKDSNNNPTNPTIVTSPPAPPPVNPTTTTPPANPTTTPPANSTTTPPANPTTSPPADSTTTAHASPTTVTETETTTASKVEARVAEVKTKGPSQIRWQTEGGKAVGTGAGAFRVPAGTKVLVAVDPKRGARSIVSVSGGVADYASLAHGKIQPRANPYADVFLGSESLGQTPFAPVDVVVGTYTVRFVHDGKEQKKTVDVKSGDVSRVTVDFGG